MEAHSWSGLPDDVLYSIIHHLNTLDFLAFGSVCNTWRLAFTFTKHSHLSSQPPFLVSPDTKDNGYFAELCTLCDLDCGRMGRLHCHAAQIWLGVSHGRLILQDEKRFFYLTVVDLRSQACFFLPEAPIIVFESVFIPPSPGAPNGVLLIAGYENMMVFSFCVLRAGRMKWTRQPLGLNPVWSMVVSGDGRRVFAVTIDQDAVVMDVVLNPKPALVMTEVLPLPPQMQTRHPSLFLAEADGELFIFDGQISYATYRLDPSTKKWEESSSLGGRSLFLSHNQCLVHHGPTAWGCETDCIYFIDGTTQAVMKFRLQDGQLECLKPGPVGEGYHPPLHPSWVSPMS